MPNTKSAMKAMRQSRKRRVVNIKTSEKYKKALRNFRKLIMANKPQEAKKAISAVSAALDKAVKKHVIHKNKAARLKSRMAKAIQKLK
jgi:small subunit ribosomal protein S20